MKGPGDVLLVSCYELGHQPMGLASPAAFLARAGYAPETIDVSVQPFDEDKVLRARFVGISVPMHTALRLGREVARRVRALNPRCHICFYGLYASLNAELLLGSGADSVIGGEYEQALVDWIEGKGDRAVVRKERLDFAVPAREGLAPLSRYAKLVLGPGAAPSLVGYVEASRGCLHACRHCPIPPIYAGRFFVVPAEIVLEDIRRLVGFGARHITFGDPDFLNGPGHSMRIVGAMHREFPELTFDVTAKIEHLLKHRRLVAELARQGCLFVVSAVESLSDEVLRRLAKGHTRADVIEAVAILDEAAIAMRPSLLPFTPWSTLADYLALLEFVEDHGWLDCVDPVQLAIRLLVPKGSLLCDDPAFAGCTFDEDRLSYEWHHVDPRMDRLQVAVASLVEQAARDEEEPHRTFERVRELAWGVAGQSARPRVPTAGPREPAPRLTEPWFC